MSGRDRFVLGRGKLKLSTGALRAFILLIAGLLLSNNLVFSQEVDIGEADAISVVEQGIILGEAPPAVSAPGPSIGAVLRVILTLILASAAIYGVVFLVKRKSKRSETIDPFLKVLASTHLGLNRYVHVVSVGSKAWLVGASDGGVNLICEIEDKDMLDAMFIEQASKEARAPAGNFPDFKSILGKLGMPVDNGVSGTENIRQRRERLKGL